MTFLLTVVVLSTCRSSRERGKGAVESDALFCHFPMPEKETYGQHAMERSAGSET